MTSSGSKDEIQPTMDHFSDPYVLQLIEALSKQQDQIEDLTRGKNEMQLVAGRYQYQFEHAMKCINRIDDFFEYQFKGHTLDNIQKAVREILAVFTDAVKPKGK